MTTRTGFFALLICLALLDAAGCKRRDKKIRVQQTDEDGAELASVVHVADPRTSTQLLKGFYEAEQNAWRWTAARFSVALRPPLGASQKGAALQLKFVVPEAVISRLKSVSLSASLNDARLSPETYTQAGEFVYSRDVPGKLLSGDVVNVEFLLDKALPPGDVERRELGIIVTSVGLDPK